MTEALFAGPDATWLAGGHRRRGVFGGTDVWLTPPWLLEALGPFDLDPCAAPAPRPWPTAAQHIARPGDGLAATWDGRVWLNPPYSDVRPWLARLAEHGRGTALVFARTETAAFHDFVWGRAYGALFLRGRLTFHRGDGRPAKGNAGAPSMLVAYGLEDAARLDEAAARGSVPGHYVMVSGER